MNSFTRCSAIVITLNTLTLDLIMSMNFAIHLIKAVVTHRYLIIVSVLFTAQYILL